MKHIRFRLGDEEYRFNTAYLGVVLLGSALWYTIFWVVMAVGPGH